MFGRWKKSARLTLWEEQRKAARQEARAERKYERRRLLIQVLLGIGTVVLVTLLIHAGGGGWGPPFRYRLNEVFPRDLRVRIDFEVVDEPATQFKREQVAIFSLDPKKMQDLQHHLTQLCVAAYTGSLDRLDENTLRFWSLTNNDLKSLGNLLRGPPEHSISMLTVFPSPLPGEIDARLFAALAFRKVRHPIESEDDLRRRLSAAFDHLAADGVLDDKELSDSVRITRKLTVHRPDEEDGQEVALEQVLKSALIGKPPRDKGPIYLQFSKAMMNDAIADRLYSLVVGDGQRPSRLPSTLTFDRDATQRARAAIVQTTRLERGMPLIEQGQPLDANKLALLKEEHKAFLESMTRGDHVQRWLALLLTVAMLGGYIGWSMKQYAPDVIDNLLRLTGVCVVIAVVVATAVILSLSPWHASVVPLTMAAMFLTIAFGQSFALAVSISLALVITFSIEAAPGHFLVLASGLTMAVLLLRSVRTRVRLIQVGFFAGLTFAVMTVAEGILTDQTWKLISADAGSRFFLGLLAGMFLSGILPFLERAFGIVTDISLLELADVSHPLLRELVQRAPGTYTHSMTVATLAEAACEAIEANPLLARVGSYFHDVGKMLKPHYFVENQQGENRHEGLAPAMSTLVIIGHVKDGVELGRQHRLPRPIIDFIQQHHGTTLIEYFYHEATKDLDEEQAGDSELIASFRYPGPKPQTREIGVVMLADAMEGAARSIDEPTPSGLMKLAHEIVLKRLLDGQFDESGLTMAELRDIEDSLTKGLIALYHTRIKYPEPAAKTAV